MLTAVATWMVAIGVALAVPVSQLRTIDVVTSCCCPDPDDCHCPDHQQGPAGKPTSIGACHRSQAQLVSPQAPVFVAPELALAAPPARAAAPVVIALADPHAAPPPTQPAAPS
jgi:hypothetical protein